MYMVGPFNLSGEWTGVYGSIVHGEYDFSLSSWFRFHAREYMVDFVPISRCHMIMAWMPHLEDAVDLADFHRPFSEASWIAMAVVFSLGAACLAVCVEENAESRCVKYCSPK